jgi:chromosome partitioning protein
LSAPRRIAFINEKGGSAKTTLVTQLGAYLALHRRRRVLAVDMDPQGQLGKVLGLELGRGARTSIDLLLDELLGPDTSGAGESGSRRTTLPIVKSRIPGLDVVVADKSLGMFPAWGDASVADPTARLAEALAKRDELASYDFVFFDAPPSFGPLTLSVLRAAEELVVPVPLTYLAMDGCAELVRTLAIVRERYAHPRLQITMVVPTFYRRTKLAHQILDRLKQRFPKEIAHDAVGYHVKIDEAQSRGLSIFEYAPRDRGAQVMAALAEELDLRGQAPAWGARP